MGIDVRSGGEVWRLEYNGSCSGIYGLAMDPEWCWGIPLSPVLINKGSISNLVPALHNIIGWRHYAWLNTLVRGAEFA